MLRLLQWLFLGHVHKWKVIKEGSASWESTTTEESSRWTRYVLQCEICGELKTYDARWDTHLLFLGYDSHVKQAPPLPHVLKPNKPHTMSLFIPPNQLQNMLDAEVGQALCGRPNIGKLVALSALMNSPQQRQMQQADNWLEPNWMDDPDWVWPIGNNLLARSKI